MERKKIELLDQCRNFCLCRNILDSYCVQADLSKAQAIPEKNLLVESAKRVSGKDGVKSYNPSCRQVDYRGMVIQGVEEIFSAASAANRQLGSILNTLESEVGLLPGSIVVAPLKTKDSIMNKARSEYASRSPGPPIAWCMDIVRGSVICNTTDEIVAVMAHLDSKPNILVQRVKNRFQHPLLFLGR